MEYEMEAYVEVSVDNKSQEKNINKRLRILRDNWGWKALKIIDQKSQSIIVANRWKVIDLIFKYKKTEDLFYLRHQFDVKFFLLSQ